jgi:hypothetical protein
MYGSSMKLAVVVDSKFELKPLDQGERIVLFSDDGSIISIRENPGFGYTHGGKEQAMDTILSMGADAVAVKEQFLCPCTYSMSKGRLMYVPVTETNLEQLRLVYGDLKSRAVEDTDPSVYYEDPHAHDTDQHVGPVNTKFDL